MKTRSLLTTKPKETPIFPNTYLSMEQKYLVNVLMPQSEIVFPPSIYKILISSSLKYSIHQLSLPYLL